MHVVATAGHVDHGKSTLVRALTGIEPDRWEAERRRGLTIDLGYAWTRLPNSGDVAFVDVPGHRRFIGNMLAGLGPAPAVLLVVAADSGWSAQSEEHLRAIDALGLHHGLLAVSRADLVEPDLAEQVRAEATARIRESSLGAVHSVVLSAVTGTGLEDLRTALDRLCVSLPPPRRDGRVRLWIDRSFTITGSGTVVTGTLGAGTISAGDHLSLGSRRLTVRGLQTLGTARDAVAPVSRVAVNLRGIAADAIHRGDALLTPDAWRETGTIDVRADQDATALPRHVICHVGTAAVEARVRPLSGTAARLTLDGPLPLEAGDRLILRDPGQEGAITGAVVIDPSPPPLTRRGDGVRRGAEVEASDAELSLADEVRRRDVIAHADARLLGHDPDGDIADPGIARLPGYLATADRVAAWQARLIEAVDAHAAAQPLDPAMPMEAARTAAGIPDLPVLQAICEPAGLIAERGRISRPGVRPSLGAKQAGLEQVLTRLRDDPFAAPEQPDLDAVGLGTKEIAAAVSNGDLIRLRDGVLLLPTSPALAMRTLASLPQPFTTSQARQALGTTRRVAIPLLEHLDSRGWTRRLDAGHREVVR